MKRATYIIRVYRADLSNSTVLDRGVTSRKKAYEIVKAAFKLKLYIQATVTEERHAGNTPGKVFEKWIENKTGKGYFIDFPTIGDTELPTPKPCPHCGSTKLHVGHILSTRLGVECECGAEMGSNYGHVDYSERDNEQYEKDLTAAAIRKWNKRIKL